MPILNLGFLAHVDAGKTSLTERVLHETGVTRQLGRVDSGTTLTDTLDLERQRGISIQSAVVSFTIGDLKVNLIDTPGHADFIAEVDRALSALDGVVMLISAVEGVQPQTRKLVRAVRGLGLPMLIFINKIDRAGARDAPLVADIARRLDVHPVSMTVPHNLGTLQATVCPRRWDDPAFTGELTDQLAIRSDTFLQAWLNADGAISRRAIRKELRRQVRTGDVVPVFFGSAMTGAGTDLLLRGIRDYLPRASEDCDDAPQGVIFKIHRDPSGEKLVFLRLHRGSLHLRQTVPIVPNGAGGEPHESRITGLDWFERGTRRTVREIGAGEIVRLHGLRQARIGDYLGAAGKEHRTGFAPPALESVVVPQQPEQLSSLYGALQQLAEQDPLIEVRRNSRNAEISVRLFGEVQKEVIASTLESEYGIVAEFTTSQPICIEVPVGTGEALELIGEASNPFAGTVGLRIEPGEPGSGIAFFRPSGALPLAFYKAIEETVYSTLTEGLCGWQVTDCVVTVTQTAYWSPVSVAGDFRKLTPLVVMDALKQAGTTVHEPFQQFTLHIPGRAAGDVLAALAAARGMPQHTQDTGDETVITGIIPTGTMRGFEQQVPGLSGGEGVFQAAPGGYQPVAGAPPERARTDFNPLNRKQYLALVSQG